MRLRFCYLLILGMTLPLTVLAESATTSSAATESTSRILGTALRSTDLDRSIKFYTAGLGMVVATTLKNGPVTEVMFSFGGDRTQPVILLYKDASPGKSPSLEHGNAYGRVILRVADADALAMQLRTAGYTVGDVQANAANHVKVFWAEDPDGYKYEITERSALKP